ncbi:MAG: T9SS type A sorting domain-containing protein [Saprospiraceae bacterium]|nr:T9SS type A sorting domain-containing protein [Saprospiraceae bacterium]
MKTFLMAIFIFGVSIAYSQTINSLTTIPFNPTVNDVVSVVCNSTHPNSGCNLISDSIEVNSNIIYVEAMHYSGMMPAICTSTDTIAVGSFQPGNYTIIYTLKNQIMSILDIDSVNFTVILSTDVYKHQITNGIKIFPNPSNGEINVELNVQLNNASLKVFDLTGKLINSYQLKNDQVFSFNSNLLPGIYFINVSDENGFLENRKLIIY